MSIDLDRRSFIGSAVGGAVALAVTPITVLAQSIEDIFQIVDARRTPDNFTYDMFAWSGEGFLAFEDGTDIARWGEDNPPSATPTPTATATPQGARGDNPLFDIFVRPEDPFGSFASSEGLYGDYVSGQGLNSRFVSLDSVSTAFALLVGVILSVSLWAAIKLRSIIAGSLWLFMVLALVLAILVDTSLVYFWVAVPLFAVGLVLAIMEAGR